MPARTDTNIAAVLVVLSLVVRSFATPPSRELAELSALAAASGPLSEAIGAAPLWELMLWGWVQLSGVGSARVLTGLLAALLTGAVYLTARRLLQPWGALSVALLVLLTPLTLTVSLDIRPGALVVLLVTAAWGAWLAPWRAAPHGAAVLAALAAHPWAALALLPQAILRPQRRWLLLAPVALLGVVWLPREPRLAPDALLNVLRSFALSGSVALAAVALLLVQVFHHPGRHSGAVAVWLAVPLLVALGAGVGLRYAVVCLPALWLLVGQGLASLPIGRRVGVTALLLALGGIALTWRMDHPVSRGDLDALAAALPEAAPGDRLAAANPEAWALVLSRPLGERITDAASGARIAAQARGSRLLWLLGAPDAHRPATEAMLKDALLLQRIEVGGGAALLVCPGCQAADLSAAIFDPLGGHDGEAVLLYTTAAAVFPDLTTSGPGRYAVDVIARGTSAGGVPAKLEIAVEGAEPEGTWVWSLPEQTAAKRVVFEAERPGTVVLRFLNDGTVDGADRNAWIEAVALSEVPR